MTIKPILFSGPMVRALLDGAKTQTRRVLPQQPRAGWEYQGFNSHGQALFYPPDHADIEVEYAFWDGLLALPCAVGDLLYVREAWRARAAADNLPPRDMVPFEGRQIWYEADGAAPEWVGKHRPSMFLPRWASRLTLRVTDVRVQRVQDISEGDAMAEGCEAHGPGLCTEDPDDYAGCYSARTAFRTLWDSMNAKPRPIYETRDGRRVIVAYESFPWGNPGEVERTEVNRGRPHYIYPNPWVAAYTFDVLRCNVDSVEE